MSAALVHSWTEIASGSGFSLAIPLPVAVPAGAVIILATNKPLGSSNPSGVADITTPGFGNAFQLNVATGVRTNAHDLGIHILHVTTALTAGQTITVTWTAPGANRIAVASVWTGLAGTFDVRSGFATGILSSSSGANGSSANPAATTTGAVTEPNCLVIGATSLNDGQTAVATGGGTEIGQAVSTGASANRGLMMQYRENDTAGTKTISASNSASSGWAAAVVTLPLGEEPPPAGEYEAVLDFDGLGSLGVTTDGGEYTDAHDKFWYGKFVPDADGGMAITSDPDDNAYAEVHLYDGAGTWTYPPAAQARVGIDFLIEDPVESPEAGSPWDLHLMNLNTHEDYTVRIAVVKADGNTPRLEWTDASDESVIQTVPLVLDRWYTLAVDWDNGDADVTISHLVGGQPQVDATFSDSPGGTLAPWMVANGGYYFDGATSKVRATIDHLSIKVHAVGEAPEEPGPPPSPGSVIVSGSKKPVSSMSVIVNGVKKPVASVSVIVGGQKVPVMSPLVDPM